MRGASRGSLAEAKQRLAAALADGADPSQLGDDLFGVTGLLDAQAGLRRVLSDPTREARAKAALGLFDDPYHGASEERERAVLLAPEHRELARRVAREAIVLLKNDGALLPLGATRRTLAVIGPLADAREAALGAWSGHGDAHDVVTVLEGIKARAGAGTEVRYAQGSGISDTTTAGFAEAVALARETDGTILVLGEGADMSGEAAIMGTHRIPGSWTQTRSTIAAMPWPTPMHMLTRA